MTIRTQLLKIADPAYRNFIIPLMPGVGSVIGVRIPALRHIAQEIARGNWQEYLVSASDIYFEERLLQGLVVGYVNCPIAEKLEITEQFIPKIDNWSICDSFCWSLRPQERDPMWVFIEPYFRSEHEYHTRFAVVMALRNFVDNTHIEQLLQLLNSTQHKGYYARMAVAWALSVCFVKFPEQTLEYLRQSTLDKWTFNKSLQKILESYRVSDDSKEIIRKMKRRNHKALK